MRLNVQSDYALRLLMHLAVNRDELITIAEVAERFGISKNHLMKVANTLGRGGFIETLRGRAGGLRLARPAASIPVGDVVRRMEGDSAIVECFQGGKGECLIIPACRLKTVFHEATEAFLAVLDRHTIGDLVKHNRELEMLLGMERA